MLNVGRKKRNKLFLNDAHSHLRYEHKSEGFCNELLCERVSKIKFATFVGIHFSEFSELVCVLVV